MDSGTEAHLWGARTVRPFEAKVLCQAKVNKAMYLLRNLVVFQLLLWPHHPFDPQ